MASTVSKYHDGSYASSYSSNCCSTKCLSKWTVLHQRHWAVLQANCCTRQFISDNKNAYSGTTNRSTMAYAVSKDKRTNQTSTCSTDSVAPACSLPNSWSVMGKTWIKDLMAPVPPSQSQPLVAEQIQSVGSVGQIQLIVNKRQKQLKNNNKSVGQFETVHRSPGWNIRCDFRKGLKIYL